MAEARVPRAGKRPAFMFYVADFLMDEAVAQMTMAERGLYITLLCYADREGSIPSDERDLVRLTRMPTLAFRQCWRRVAPKWVPLEDQPGRLVNPRQLHDQLVYARRVQLATVAGVQGGRKSAQVRRGTQATCKPTPTFAFAFASASKIGTPETQLQEPQLTLSGPDGPVAVAARQDAIRWREEFQVLWSRHPGRGRPGEKLRKRNRAKAEAKYLRMKPTPEQSQRILAGHAAACASRQWQEGYVEDLHVWFGNLGWEDEDVEGPGIESERERWAREQREGSQRWLEERRREREGGGAA